MVEEVAIESIAQHGVEVAECLAALNLDRAPMTFAAFELGFEAVDFVHIRTPHSSPARSTSASPPAGHEPPALTFPNTRPGLSRRTPTRRASALPHPSPPRFYPIPDRTGCRGR